MNITMKTLPGLPGPHEVAWVDEALGQAAAASGTLIARPIMTGDGMLVAFGADLPGGQHFTLVDRHRGPSAGPARYMQSTRFDQRDPEWCAAYDRAGQERIYPAVKDVPGWTEVFTCRSADGTTVTISLAESIEALQNCITAIMSIEPLPWENRAHLTGPDAVTMLQLMHVELPS
jgi:hypothetical protein